jgi:5'-deoxynucleotidase
MSHFFAYLSRMKFIKRWGLMHNTYPENVQEHSLRVAHIAHGLGLIRNKMFKGTVNPDRLAVMALYHDVGEVLIGDLPAPIKYFNPDINKAYRGIEATASSRLLAMLPDGVRAEYQPLLHPDDSESELWEIVKAADKLCAYIKCLEEMSAGNREFAKAEASLRQTVEELDLPEVKYFLETFVPSFRLTLDELG